jgi:hypothetical protein
LYFRWIPGVLSLGVKRPGREADHSPYSAEVKEYVELYLYSPNTPSWRGAQLKKAQGQLYLYLYFYQREGGWRRLHNEELHNLYTSTNIVRVII